MSLNVLWFLTLVLICAAASTLLGVLLIARLRVLLVPKPRISFLSDILSFDKVLKDNITLLGKDGTLTQTLVIKGVDVSIKTPEQIATLLNHKQRCLDLLSELGASFKILTLREEQEHQFDSGKVSPVLINIHDSWMSNFKKTYANQHYLVITHAPKKENNLWRLLRASGEQANLAKLNECVSIAQEILHDFDLELLTNGESEHSPLLSFWAGLINGEPTPIRLHSDNISERIASHIVHFNPKEGLITYQTGAQEQYSAVVSLKTWGEISTPALLQEIEALPSKLVILQLFKGMTQLEGTGFLKYQQGQSQLLRRNLVGNAEFEKAIEILQTKEGSLYTYQLSIFAFATSSTQLAESITDIKKIFRQYGFVPLVETLGIEWLWRSQFPGIDHFIKPTHPLSNNLAHLLSFHREPVGLKSCDWGEGAIRLFKTPTGGAYALQLHIQEQKEALAHSLIVAPAGSGKTTFFQHLIGGALRHANLRAYIFDRFSGTRIFTEAVNGTQVDLSDSSSLFNPLVCEDSASNRVFIQQFFLMLAKTDDSESVEIASRALDILFKIPSEKRILSHLFESLFDVNSLIKQGLRKWAVESAYSRWFNGSTQNAAGKLEAYDALDLQSSRLITFEMTEIQSSPELASAVTFYIMHRIRAHAKSEASPHLIFIDETKPMLAEPAFAKHVATLLLEHRKLRGSVNLCFQDAGSIVNSGIAPIILEQCPTRFLFPNPAASKKDYAIFELTDSEWDYIKGTSRISRTLKHSVLVKKLHESVILDIDLSTLGPLLQLYRSGAEPVRLVRELQQQWGMSKWVEKYLAGF
jgi:type IV secretion/conjugal transfer VirB4 family ATPase